MSMLPKNQHLTFRHENWPLLLPLLLTNLCDSVEANVEESRKLWSDVGAQWLAEEAKRDKRVKDRIEFPEEEPRHYPQNGKINRNYFC